MPWSRNCRQLTRAMTREYSDVFAWMVKALGNAKNPKYRPAIQEIAARSADQKVVRYAKKALEAY